MENNDNYISFIKAELVKYATKEDVKKRAELEGFLDLALGKKGGKGKTLTKQELIDEFISRLYLRDELLKAKSKQKAISLATKYGVFLPNEVMKLNLKELKKAILNGGVNEEDIQSNFMELERLFKVKKENELKKWRDVDYLRSHIKQIREKYGSDVSDLYWSLRHGKAPKQEVLGLILGLIDKASFRIGNETSARYGVYGVSTLPVSSVEIDTNNNTATFRYVGKKSVPQTKQIKDSDLILALASLKKFSEQHHCRDEKNPRLFCYTDNKGDLKIIKDYDVRKYLKELTKGRVSSLHRFRALRATDLVSYLIMDKLYSYEEAIREASKVLGHARKINGEWVPDEGRTVENSYLNPALKTLFGYGRSSRQKAYREMWREFYRATKKTDFPRNRKGIIDYMRHSKDVPEGVKKAFI